MGISLRHLWQNHGVLVGNAVAAICVAVAIIAWGNILEWYYKLGIPTHASVLAFLVGVCIVLAAVTAYYNVPSRVLVAPWVIALAFIVMFIVLRVGGDGYRYRHENCWTLTQVGSDPGTVHEAIACVEGSAPPQGRYYDGVFPASGEGTHNRDCARPALSEVKRVFVWKCVRTFNVTG